MEYNLEINFYLPNLIPNNSTIVNFKIHRSNSLVQSEESLHLVVTLKSCHSDIPTYSLKLLSCSLVEDWPFTEASVTKPHEYQRKLHPFSFSIMFCFSHFRGPITAQSAPILRMARTVWKNVQMAYKGQTVSFSSMLIRIESAIHAIQTAPKGKHPCWPRTPSHMWSLPLTSSTNYVTSSYRT